MHQRRGFRISAARIWERQNVIIAVLLGFILLSLLLHGITLYNLLRVRQIVSTQLDVSANQMAQLRQQRIETSFPVQQTFTIDTTVTISETVDVPINLNVPIQQNVSFPLNTPLGSIPFEVPIDVVVPISDTVQVPINKEIPFRADIPINTEVPVQLPLSEPPVGNVLEQLETGLRELRQQLNN